MNPDERARLQAKTPEARFKYTLQTAFAFSAKMASLVLEEAQAHLLGSPQHIQPGQIRAILATRQAFHGQALAATPTTEVLWTVDGGAEDQQVGQEHGLVGLRQHRLQRLLEEALEQGGVATQEDLARVLHVTPRTIKRDFAALRAAGRWLPSRGYLQGIGRGQTHKAQIIGRWLQGETYDQLARHTHHSLSAIRRYVQTFSRVLQLHQDGFEPGQIAHLVQIGVALVQEYLTLWQTHETPATRARLEEHLGRVQGGSAGEKKRRP